jgi:hypothetical protein
MNYKEFLETKQKKIIQSGFEFKESYFNLNKRNHNAAKEEKGQLKLF